jgi:uncharacterized protein with FMN-binding domain
MSVYAVGYLNTRAAGDELSAQDAAMPSPTVTTVPTIPVIRAAMPSPARGVIVPSPTSVAHSASPPAAAAYRDGTYVGLGTSRHGNIEATVVIQGGKIVSAAVSRCLTRYPCSQISELPGKVVARQGVTVDHVSGATDSSTAYRQAVANALAKAT